MESTLSRDSPHLATRVAVRWQVNTPCLPLCVPRFLPRPTPHALLPMPKALTRASETRTTWQLLARAPGRVPLPHCSRGPFNFTGAASLWPMCFAGRVLRCDLTSTLVCVHKIPLGVRALERDRPSLHHASRSHTTGRGSQPTPSCSDPYLRAVLPALPRANPGLLTTFFARSSSRSATTSSTVAVRAILPSRHHRSPLAAPAVPTRLDPLLHAASPSAFCSPRPSATAALPRPLAQGQRRPNHAGQGCALARRQPAASAHARRRKRADPASRSRLLTTPWWARERSLQPLLAPAGTQAAGARLLGV